MMGKETTTITLDSELKTKAKAAMINISGLVETAIRKKLGEKSSLPEQNLKVVCGQCMKEINEGYKCEQYGLFCKECQDNWKMAKYCKHDQFGEHLHEKWPMNIN